MTQAPLIFDEDIRERVRGRLQATGWTPSKGDLGDGLVEVFAQLAGVAVDRLNQVPDKNLLAFLDLVGTRLDPPLPSRVPVTFTLAPGTASEVLVPSGTQVAAEQEEGDPGPLLFETERNLVATPSRLVAAFVREPGADRYRDVTAAALGQAPAVAPFTGTEPIPHHLLMAHDAFALSAPKEIVLELGPGSLWGHALRWSFWDGDRWVALDGVFAPSFNEVGGTVEFHALPGVPVLALPHDPVPRPWLRATLLTSVPALPGSPPGRLRRADAAVDAALRGASGSGTLPVDLGTPFPPFEEMAPGQYLALRCDDAFSKPGARVALAFTIDGVEPGSTRDVSLDWHYSREGQWGLLGRSRSTTVPPATPPATGFADLTRALMRSGVVVFDAPLNWRPVTLGTETGMWLIATITQADYRTPELPLVTAVEPGYDWPLPTISALAAHAEVNLGDLRPELAFANLAPVDLNKDVLPFGEAPRPNDAFYLASLAFAAPTQHVVLTIELTNPGLNGGGETFPPPATPTEDLRLAWEHWDAEVAAWRLLGESGPGAEASQPAGFSDETEGLVTQPGPDRPATVRFDLPPSAGAVEVNGELRAWLRVRIARGAYGHDATYRLVDPDHPEEGYYVEPADHRPPSIHSLRIGFSFETPRQAVAALATENDFVLRDRTPELGRGPIEPFTPPRDTRPTLYVGMDRAFSDQQIQLFAGVPALAYSTARPDDDGAGGPPVVTWEYWNGRERRWARLEPIDETDGFTRPGLVSFIGPAQLSFARDFGLPFATAWLRARWERGVYPAAPRLSRLLTNTTWAVNATTTLLEELGSSPGTPGLARRLSRTPVLPGERIEVGEPEPPVATELQALGANAVTIVRDAAGRPQQTWVRWLPVDDFYGSGPRSRHYVLDRSTGELRFGDGRRGLIPPAGQSSLRAARYRSGGGALGNRPAGRITQLKSAMPYVVGVTNPEPAAGGADAGTLADARIQGPRRLRHRDRAVTLADYEDIAVEASPEVARAKALPVRELADAGRVRVVVVPDTSAALPTPSLELLAGVRDHLRARMSGSVELWVGGPGWSRVDVTGEVVPIAIEHAATVEGTVLARLADFLHPLRGGPDGSGWEFGRRLHASELIAVLERVDGVDHVRSIDVAEQPATDAPTPEAVLIWSGEHHITMVPPDTPPRVS